MHRPIAFLFVATLIAQAQPAINPGGVVNAASYSLSGLPGSSIAQGSIFAIFGSNLGPDGGSSATSFPLPTDGGGLSGTMVRVEVQPTDRHWAPILYAGPGQVTAIMPSDVPVGQVWVSVFRGATESNQVPVKVVRSSFGVFTRSASGIGPGAIQNFEAGALPDNTIYHGAQAGSIAVLWGTGLGPVPFDDDIQPTQGNLAMGAEVYVAGQRVVPDYQGRSGCCAGLDQINFRLPSNLTGCYVPVAVIIGGVMSNTVTMAVSPTNGICSDPLALTQEDLAGAREHNSFSLGALILTRQQDSSSMLDTGSGWFGTYTPDQLAAWRGPAGSPSIGGCIVSQFRDTKTIWYEPVRPALKDAGTTITVAPAGGGAARQMTASGGTYAGTLGGGDLPSFLVPGVFNFDNGIGSRMSGGVLAFNGIPITVTNGTTWNNPPTAAIPRTQPLSLTWARGDATREFVRITGYSFDTGNSLGAAFVCSAPADAHSFSVPAQVLSALPAGAGQLTLGAASYTGAYRATPSGIGLGAIYPMYRLTGIWSVSFQ